MTADMSSLGVLIAVLLVGVGMPLSVRQNGRFRKARRGGSSRRTRVAPIVSSAFYDANSTAQRRYEMLRLHEFERLPLKKCTRAFSYSIPMYKRLKKAYLQHNILGLVPKAKGPKHRYSVTEECLARLLHNRHRGFSLDQNLKDLGSSGFRMSRATLSRVLRDRGYPKKTPTKRAPNG